MLQHDLHDIPVVSKDGKLVGVASRVDIGTTIVSAWARWSSDAYFCYSLKSDIYY